MIVKENDIEVNVLGILTVYYSQGLKYLDCPGKIIITGIKSFESPRFRHLYMDREK